MQNNLFSMKFPVIGIILSLLHFAWILYVTFCRINTYLIGRKYFLFNLFITAPKWTWIFHQVHNYYKEKRHTMEYIKNNHHSTWRKLAEKYYKGECNDPDIGLIVNNASDLGEVTELHHFFPLAYGIYQVRNLKLTLTIYLQMNAKDQWFPAKERLFAFLKGMSAADYCRVKIVLNNQPIVIPSNNWTVSRVFPIFEVWDNQENAINCNYRILRNPVDEKHLTNSKTGINYYAPLREFQQSVGLFI